jgi:Domain of unknown function (DUF4136)
MIERIHGRSFVLLAALAFLPGAAPASAAQKPPRYEFDEAFDFTKLHTFDLVLDPSKQTEGALAGPLLPKLADLMQELLVAKGYVRSGDQPDFVLTFDVMVADDYSSTSWSGHAEVAKGLLVLRTSVPSEKEPFWMGADVTGIKGKITQDKAWKKAEQTTRRILAGFPPPKQ